MGEQYEVSAGPALTEWLEESGLVPSRWHERLAAVQRRAAYEAAAVPAQLEALGPSLKLDSLSYEQVLEIKKGLAGQQKGLFGGLAGGGIWDQLQAAYEQQGLWRADAAQQLALHADTTAPALKRAVIKLQGQLGEIQQQAAEALRNSTAASKAYSQECSSLDIAGHKPEAELDAQQLITSFSAAANQLQSRALATPALSLYRGAADLHSGGKGDIPQGLEVLGPLLEKGDGQEGQSSDPAALERDLREVAAFLAVRRAELGGEGSTAGGFFRPSQQEEKPEQVEEWLRETKSVLSLLRGSQQKGTLRGRGRERKLNRLAQLKRREEDCRRLAEALEAKGLGLQGACAAAAAQLIGANAAAMALKLRLEQDLSAATKHSVRIVGV